jgi:hypothetical protein
VSLKTFAINNRSGDPFISSEDPDFTAALLGFNGEAVLYCQGISDPLAHDYALDYWRMIGDRARGVEVSFVRAPFGLFEPNRNLIRATLERISEKYFPLR